jgi:hypothetical protein
MVRRNGARALDFKPLFFATTIATNDDEVKFSKNFFLKIYTEIFSLNERQRDERQRDERQRKSSCDRRSFRRESFVSLLTIVIVVRRESRS